MIQSKRHGYEFSYQTKLDALKRDSFTCQNCHKHKQEVEPPYLEIHHIVPIWFVVRYLPEMSAIYFHSIDNAVCLCKECHLKEHERQGVADYWTLAIALLGVNYDQSHQESVG